MRPGLSMALAIAFCMLTGRSAAAQTRVAVHDFYGPHGSALRLDVANVLERQEGVVVVSKRDIQRAAARLGVDSFSPEGRKAISRELLLSAWLTGVVQQRKSRASLTIIVYDGAEHARVGRTVLSGGSSRRLRSAIQHRLWEKSRETIMRAVAPLPPGRAPVETMREATASLAFASPASAVAVSSAPHAAALHQDGDQPASLQGKQSKDALHALLGFGSPYRSLRYSDPLTPALGDHQQTGAPMLDLTVSYFPARGFTDGWLSFIGVEGAAQAAFGMTTTGRSGQEYDASYGAYRVGLRGSMPVGSHAVSVFSGYAIRRFGLKGKGDAGEAPTPDVDYRTLRSGLGGQLALSDVISVGADAAWLHVLSVGELGKWFPRATASGLELALHANYALTRHLFARMSATYQRTVFNFRSQPGDQRVAGGATDQFLTMSVGAGVSL